MVDLAEIKKLMARADDKSDTDIGRAFAAERLENALVIVAPALIRELEMARECVRVLRSQGLPMRVLDDYATAIFGEDNCEPKDQRSGRERRIDIFGAYDVADDLCMRSKQRRRTTGARADRAEGQRPEIRGLDVLLEKEDDTPIEILPDGSILPERQEAQYRQTIGDKTYQVRFVAREHIKDRPTEANPSPIRVLLVYELDGPDGIAFSNMANFKTTNQAYVAADIERTALKSDLARAAQRNAELLTEQENARLNILCHQQEISDLKAERDRALELLMEATQYDEAEAIEAMQAKIAKRRQRV